MTQDELIAKYRRLVWSNSHASVMQLLSADLLRSRFAELADFTEVLGFAAVEKQWQTIYAQEFYVPEIMDAKPYVEEILTRLKNGQTEPTPEYRQTVAAITKRQSLGGRLSHRWHRPCFAPAPSH